MVESVTDGTEERGAPAGAMPTRPLGDGLVGAVGLGCAGLSVADHPQEAQSVRVIHAALDMGATLIDTARCYVPSHRAPAHNEALIRRALRQWGGGRDGVVVATKGGIRRVDDRYPPGHPDWVSDYRASARPEDILGDCEVSLRGLEVECIDLYQLHSPDPEVPIGETMLAFRSLLDAGKIRAVGLCNVDIEQIEAARTVVPVVSVQNRMSIQHTESRAVLAHCEAEGLAFIAYSPLGGLGQAGDLGSRQEALDAIAARRGVSPQQVALAWLLALSPILLPIVGARRQATARDSLAAAALELTPAEREQIAA